MAASRHTAVEVVKYALYKQSYGGAVGRFYVQRTLEHLQRCNHYFKEDLKEVSANLPSSANHAFRRFVFENIPQLKYRNPTIVFNFKFDDRSPTFLKLIFADGEEQNIQTEQKQSEIYNEIIELTKKIDDDNETDVAKDGLT